MRSRRRHRFEGPNSLVPFIVKFHIPVGVEALVKAARRSAREERQPIFLAVGTESNVFGAIPETDGYFQTTPVGEAAMVQTQQGQPAAEIFTGMSVARPGVGLLHLPIPRRLAFGSKLSRVVARWHDADPGEELGQWQSTTILWGHVVRRRYWGGRKYVVEQFIGATILAYLPDSPGELATYFARLNTELGLSQCWVLFENKLHHVRWK